jgi:hypothetical protein
MNGQKPLHALMSLGALLVLAFGLSGSSHGVVHAQRPATISFAGRPGGLVVAAPGERVGSASGAGGVNILYSAPDGLSTMGCQWFDQNHPDVFGSAEAYDGFGYGLAIGDFNDDGETDLAVGVPYEGVGSEENAGGLNVLYGSNGGFAAAGSQWFDQRTPGMIGSAERGDSFGYALAAGDFDGDAYSDLVVGAPNEDVGSEINAGGVQVLYGSSAGLTTSGNQWFDQRSAGVLGTPEAHDHFGRYLAVGDLNGDGFDDVAVGVPGEDVEGAAAAGGVNVLYGSPGGLTGTGSQWFDQGTPGMIGSPEPSDSFGYTLAIGDLDGDGYADLVVGVPFEQVGAETQAGGVNILYGSSAGLNPSSSQWFDQNNPGVFGSAEANDNFGYGLAIADLNGDGYGDLSVGVPGEGVGSEERAGGVNVLYGSRDGLSTSGSWWFDQRTPGMVGSAEEGDEMGHALAAGDMNGDGYADLVVGAPYEALGDQSHAGGVNVLYGSWAGLSASSSQWFDQNNPGVIGSAETHDFFGYRLAVWSPPEHSRYLPLLQRGRGGL